MKNPLLVLALGGLCFGFECAGEQVTLKRGSPATQPFVEPFNAGNPVVIGPNIHPATAPATQQAAGTTQPARLAAEPFKGPAAGITFRPPADLKEIPTSGAVEQIVSYSDKQDPTQKETTTLVVTRVIPGKPTPLLAPNKSESGMLEIYESELASPPLSARILRSDTINAGKDGSVNVGMLACRYTVGPQRFLRQRAVVEGGKAFNDKGGKVGGYYYVFDYTIPTSKGKEDTDDKEENVDPNERLAVQTFRQVLDSIELVDLKDINREVTERLYRTRTLLVNLTPRKLQASIVPDRICLIVQGGKEIGYLYTEESWEPRDNQDGFVVSVHTRTYPTANDRTEAVAEMFCTADRKYESWASVANGARMEKDKPLEQDQNREIGNLSFERTRVLDEKDGGIMQPKDHVDAKQPPVRIIDHYMLTVNTFTKNTAKPPVEREVPPYYLPQAFAQMVPRLVPLGEAKGYCFAVWVGGDRREVMRRFIDVELEAQVHPARPTRAGHPSQGSPRIRRPTHLPLFQSGRAIPRQRKRGRRQSIVRERCQNGEGTVREERLAGTRFHGAAHAQEAPRRHLFAAGVREVAGSDSVSAKVSQALSFPRSQRADKYPGARRVAKVR